MNVPWPVEAEAARLVLELPLVRARASDQEAHATDARDHAVGPGQRLERVLEALLVDEPADEQDELLLGRGELRAEAGEVLDGLQVVGVDPVGRDDDALLVDPEDVGDVAAHVVRADQHLVGDVDHPALGAVDV